ncbi:MAG TPA: methionyl-tRNA formyltransferase [Turneriella sp.]|nr:methionyl-tRNA formyltransferase [Turneriella sp.]
MTEPQKTRVVFWGSPRIAAEFLTALTQHEKLSVIACVTQPEKILQRQGKTLTRSTVHERAAALEIPVFTPKLIKKEADELLHALNQIGFDIFVVLAYGKILPQSIIDAPRLKAVNFHGSLLPLLRGASPIEHALLYGFKQTGWTLQRIVSQLDAGSIIAQSQVAIAEDETTQTLYAKMTADLLEHGIAMLMNYIEGRADIRAQDESQATHCGKILAEDGRLIFTESAHALRNRYRAFTPRPGVFAFFRGKKIKLTFNLTTPPKAMASAPGSLLQTGKTELWLVCADGHALLLESVTPEGKKTISAADFINGYRVTTGDIFN